MKVDVVLGLAYGDEGKGKVSSALLSRGGYTHCLRFNGGGNAGHTIYHKGKKYVTHLVPSGIFHGIPCVIGPGVVLNLEKFKAELDGLRQDGLDAPVIMAHNAHVVTAQHIAEEAGESKVGTTRTGNGPAFRDKYARLGVRTQDVLEQTVNLISYWEEQGAEAILAEGAQAFGLDIDWGDYPYVTSSHCGVAGVLTAGIPAQAIRNVYGVIKAYDTYVGAKVFQDPSDAILDQIQTVGQEWGATTGRKRQTNYLGWDLIEQAILSNGVTHLVVNKVDILEQVGVWKLRYRGETLNLGSREGFENWILTQSKKHGVQEVIFSTSPEFL